MNLFRFIIMLLAMTVAGGTIFSDAAVIASGIPWYDNNGNIVNAHGACIVEDNGKYHDKFELAKIGQSTEHNYCGVNCGIMDQFASVMGQKGMLMRLDCRSMEFEYYPFAPEDYELVLDIAKECGVTGSRIMGGGFGGCTINLVKKNLRDNFVETAKTKFKEKYGHESKVYPVVISDGAHKEA